MTPGQPKRDAAGAACRDAAGAACRNAAVELEGLARQLRTKCLHSFSEPAEVPVETVLALHEIDSAVTNLHAAAEAYYDEPNDEVIQAMRRIRQQAMQDAIERERRANG